MRLFFCRFFFIFFVLKIQNVVAQSQISGIVNIYKPVISIDNHNCGNAVTLSNVTGFNINDQVVIIQMNGAYIDSTNTSSFGSISDYNGAGNFEILTIHSLSGNQLIFDQLLENYYDPINGKVQVISFPKHNNPTAISQLQALPWDGSIGGVLALDFTGTLTLNANIDVSGFGFRGGTISNNPDGSCGSGSYSYYYPLNQPGGSWSEGGAEKGEGIALLSSSKMAGKGALANGGGGGNKHNHGGGGGGNYTAGGKGGNSLIGCSANSNGGLGGIALPTIGNQLFLGGGGGCGDDNNNVGSPGTNGGGIIILRGDEIVGNNHSLLSNGADQTIIGSGIADGAGGGGAGGSVFLDVKQFTGSLNVTTDGGNGGDQNPYYGCVGPGGGGGTGVILSCLSPLPSNVKTSMQPGNAGKFLSASFSQCANSNYGAIQGSNNAMGGTIAGSSCLVNTSPLNGTTTISDTVLCKGDSLLIDKTLANATHLWQNNSTKATFQVNQKGIYWVEITYQGCTTIDTIVVEESECDTTTEEMIEIPNVFTPNGDGINDFFMPLQIGNAISLNTIVYNRWGREVFKSDKIEIDWDGLGVSDGTYFWVIKYVTDEGVEKSFNGFVTIIR